MGAQPGEYKTMQIWGIATGQVIFYKNWIQIVDFSARVTLKVHRWPRKIMGHLSYSTSSFVHLCKAIGIFQLELQSGPSKFGSKLAIFLSRVTLKSDGWPWNWIGHIFYTTSSLLHSFKAISEFRLELHCGNSQFGLKSAIFCPVWPHNMMDEREIQ